MIYYVQIFDKTISSYARFPHLCMRRCTYEEALEEINVDVENIKSHYCGYPPDTVFPCIITNDSVLSYNFRKVFSFFEFKQWCGLEIDLEHDRDYFIRPNHKLSKYLKQDGLIIFNKFEEIVKNKISGAEMIKGSDYEEFDDGYGQTYYSSSPIEFDNGWRTYDSDQIYLDDEIIGLHKWWRELRYDVKEMIIPFYHIDKHLDYLFLQNFESEYHYTPKLIKHFIPDNETLRKMINDVTNLSFNECKNLDLEFISTLTQIRQVTLTRCENLTNLQSLLQLDNLNTLNLKGSTFSSFKFLNKLKNLEKLTLDDTKSGNLFSEINLSELANLKVLGLKNTDITTLEFIKCPNLEELDISYCQVDDLLSLYTLKNLKSLTITGCKKIKKLTPLQNLKSLIIINTNFTAEDILKYEELLGYKIESIIRY